MTCDKCFYNKSSSMKKHLRLCDSSHCGFIHLEKTGQLSFLIFGLCFLLVILLTYFSDLFWGGDLHGFEIIATPSSDYIIEFISFSFVEQKVRSPSSLEDNNYISYILFCSNKKITTTQHFTKNTCITLQYIKPLLLMSLRQCSASWWSRFRYRCGDL